MNDDELIAAIADLVREPEPSPAYKHGSAMPWNPDLRPQHVRDAEKAAKRKAATVRDPAECW